MYRKKAQSSQKEFVDFYLRFGGELDPKNRWIQLTRLIPWESYEKSYAGLFPSKRGAPAKPFRMALGALLIKNMKRITDEEVDRFMRVFARATGVPLNLLTPDR